MIFQPTSYQIIEIDGIEYSIAEHPAAPGMPYGQEGRQAVVYKLLCEEGDKAFKVFKSRFRTPDLVMLAEKIEQYASMPGLVVCRREVLTPQGHLDLLKVYRELTFAVLMPWIEGSTWMEVVLGREEFTLEQSLLVARKLVELLSNMEQNRIAHCDISGANLILSPGSRLELVDVEGIYAPGLPQPRALPAGSPGYGHRTAPQGLWSPEADRFAGAVLLVEVLGWCDERIRERAWGESYFNPRELQQENDRYRLMVEILSGHWGVDVSQLFSSAWLSNTPSECPTLSEWLVALPEKVPKVTRRKEIVSLEVRAVKEDYGRLIMQAERKVRGGNIKEAESLYLKAAARAPADIVQEIEQRLLELEKQREGEVKPVLKRKLGTKPATDHPCPHCRRSYSLGESICPYCEKRRGEPVTAKPREERPKRNVPLWVWMMIGVVVIGLVIAGVIYGIRGEGLLAYLATNTPVPFSTRKKLPTPTLGVGSTMLSEMDGMLMVYVPAGEFEMGANANQGYEICMEYHSDCKMSWFEHEEPTHEVYLDAFWVYQTEVTNEMYEQCVQAGGCGFPNDTEFFDDNYYANHPVVAVTWYDAEDYCDWAEKRLPTEAEWEKAARGEDERVYPWGNVFDGRLVNFCDINCPIYDADEKFDDGYAQWSPVGFYLYGVSPYGALDMAGNVDEWVADWYDENYYAISSYKNPQGPSSGNDKVLRGGAWYEYPWNVRAASRYGVAPESNDPYKGFRCVFSP